MTSAMKRASQIALGAAIFVAGYEGEGGRLLFIRTDSERKAEGMALANMQRRLGMEMTVTWAIGDQSDEEDLDPEADLDPEVDLDPEAGENIPLHDLG